MHRGLLAGLLPLLLVVPLGEAGHAGSNATYVGGTFQHVGPATLFGGLCQDPWSPSPVGVGQACFLQAPDPAHVTITVEDNYHGTWAFEWEAFIHPTENEPNPLPCDIKGEGFGSVVIALPAICPLVMVRLYVGATTGTVVLT
jgi:hypothetical protein